MAEISETVKVLCARMETNPEDFMYTHVGVYQTPKFHLVGESLKLRLMNIEYHELNENERRDYKYLWYYTDEEIVLLKDAYYKMCRKQNAIDVLNTLFNSEEKDKTTERIAKHLAQSIHGVNTSTIRQNSVNSVLQPGFSMSTTATGIHMANQLYSTSGVINGNK